MIICGQNAKRPVAREELREVDIRARAAAARERSARAAGRLEEGAGQRRQAARAAAAGAEEGGRPGAGDTEHRVSTREEERIVGRRPD